MTTSSLIMSLTRVPYFIMVILALIFAIARWNRHQLTSGLVATACIIDIVVSLVSTFVIPTLTNGDSDKMMLLYAGTGLIHSLGFGMMTLAAFTERKNAEQEPTQRW